MQFKMRTYAIPTNVCSWLVCQKKPNIYSVVFSSSVKEPSTDFTGIDIKKEEFDTLNLQQFYKLHDKNNMPYGMSVSDIYFMELTKTFKMLYTTHWQLWKYLRIVIWKEWRITKSGKTRLLWILWRVNFSKKYGKRFCNTDRDFKNKLACMCSECKSLFLKKYLDMIKEMNRNKCNKKCKQNSMSMSGIFVCNLITFYVMNSHLFDLWLKLL